MKQGNRVLVVDDEKIIRVLFSRLLEKDYSVTAVGSGREAVDLLRRKSFDYVFLDIRMPGMNGVETYGKIKKVRPETQVYMMTAFEDPELVRKALDDGAEGCLYKPFDVVEVMKAVREKKVALDKIPVKTNGTMMLLKVEDVFYAKAVTKQNYVSLHTYAEHFLARSTLSELEGRLSKELFYRTHRSFLVNLDKVEELVPLSREALLLIVADANKSRIPVSRGRAKELKRILGV